jgi:Sir2 family/Zinc finger, ZZ type
MDNIQSGSVARCRQPIKPRKQKNLNSKNSQSHATPTTSSSEGSSDGTDIRSSIQNPAKCLPRPPSERLKNRVRSISSSDETVVSGSESEGFVCGGVMKPAITFFGETLDDTVRRSLEADRNKADALIVIGTSLSVAPISKVIEYLPPNIPRILINRTVVHPSSSSSRKNQADTTAGESNSDENDEAHEEIDFRGDGYVFDAYLLGFSDDVARSLASSLSLLPSEEKSDKYLDKKRRRITTTPVENRYCARTLISALDDNKSDSEWNQKDWSGVTVPPERVILFPGAQGSSRDDTSSNVVYGEVVHCDGCSHKIDIGEGTIIYKCAACFDYDLCIKCYPTLSTKHCDGTHEFTKEKMLVSYRVEE